ncbi:MAG: ABC transporter ATP-binding protein [Pirellulaceae bacterium]|jgi:ABC-2 type transport system ATP-binding protein|nr:ABC transporter ATP-binding protein [Pirellulaceae bacterium]
MLRVEHLTKDFGPLRAVNDLSFELQRGRICGFVGPNGAGKTTTMRMIATLEEPTAGTISVNGMSLFDDPYRVRRSIGFMPDHYGVYPALTCEDYLEFYARAYEVPRGLRESRIRNIMEFTGLERIAAKPVESLSKGMKQRLNLGRALINDPMLLIMDEPAAGLDPRARVELRFLVKSLAERGKTIFISSHILTELAEICDHMLIIDHGRSVAFGRFEDIQKNLQEGTEITLRLLHADQVPRLELQLSERPHVQNIRVDPNGLLTFNFRDELARFPDLLRELLNAGFSIVECRHGALSMEDVFLKITEGSLT